MGNGSLRATILRPVALLLLHAVVAVSDKAQAEATAGNLDSPGGSGGHNNAVQHLAKEVQNLSGDTKLLAKVENSELNPQELPVGLSSSKQASEGQPEPSEAYVTLCYCDSYVLGVRVLGQSLRETETSRDLVAVVARGRVSEDNIETLSLDGWVIVMVDIVPNPGKVRQCCCFIVAYYAVTLSLHFDRHAYDTSECVPKHESSQGVMH
eukprot:scaffold314700_cov24-Prasinocladus_malaysianus.AAC.1